MSTARRSTTVVLVVGDAEVVLGQFAVYRPDLTLVDTLARLQLAARRLGCSIRLLGPPSDLCDLLDLVGLTDVIGASPGLGLELDGETEGGEQLGVQEAVEPGDLSA